MEKNPSDLINKLQYFELKEDDIIGKDFTPPYRYCFENKPYTEPETELISKLKKNPEYIDLDKSYWTDENLLRFILAAKKDLKLTKKYIYLHNKWREETILNPDYYNDTSDLIKEGFIYMAGRDNRYRPILVVNAKKIIDTKASQELILKIFIKFTTKICKDFLVFGKIENFVVIVDLMKVGTLSLPVKTLKMIGNIFESNFRTKLYKFFVLNAPWTVSVLFLVIKALDKNIQKKITVSRENSPKQMAFINKNQIEKKFNGLKNEITTFWPIQETDLDPKNIFTDEIDLENYTNNNNETEIYDGTEDMDID